MTQHRITIHSAPERVFATYADTAAWPTWDSEVAAVDLPSGLQLGAEGILTPRKGPKARIMVTEITPNRSFTITARLPLCKMQFGHQLTANQGNVIATHWVQFSGPLAFLFRRLIGAGITKTLPETLRGLKLYCETQKP
jgi:hypothetical protein